MTTEGRSDFDGLVRKFCAAKCVSPLDQHFGTCDRRMADRTVGEVPRNNAQRTAPPREVAHGFVPRIPGGPWYLLQFRRVRRMTRKR